MPSGMDRDGDGVDAEELLHFIKESCGSASSCDSKFGSP